MRIFNHVLSFLAVSFALVVYGKVNKTDLYHAYFKTIEEVETRNSTDIFAFEFSGINSLEQPGTFSSSGPSTGLSSIAASLSYPIVKLVESSCINLRIVSRVFLLLRSNPPMAP